MKKCASTTPDIVITASSNVIQGNVTSLSNLKRIIQGTRQRNQRSPPNLLTLPMLPSAVFLMCIL